MGPWVVPPAKLDRPLSSDLGLRDQEKQRGQACAGAEDNGREVGNRAGRVEQRDRVGDAGTTGDGPKVVSSLEGFLLPNHYSPAQPLALDCRRDRGRLVAFISHQDR